MLENIIILGLISCFVFFIGAIFGSFLNVLVYRLEKDEAGALMGRSACPSCKHILGGFDLIPLFSFLFLKRKCRYCHKPIAWRYFLVECVTGVFALYIFWSNMLSGASGWELLVESLYVFLILCFSLYDIKSYLIPDRFVVPGIVLAFIVSIFSLFIADFFAPSFLSALLGALIAILFLGGQVYFSQETWMGWGDVYIGVFMGLALGWKLMLLALFISYILGAFIGVFLLIIGKKQGKSQLPFGPFLGMGMIICLANGQQILDWYVSLL